MLKLIDYSTLSQSQGINMTLAIDKGDAIALRQYRCECGHIWPGVVCMKDPLVAVTWDYMPKCPKCGLKACSSTNWFMVVAEPEPPAAVFVDCQGHELHEVDKLIDLFDYDSWAMVVGIKGNVITIHVRRPGIYTEYTTETLHYTPENLKKTSWVKKEQ